MMDRRRFLGSTVAGMVLASAPAIGRASIPPPVGNAPVSLVFRGDLPDAVALSMCLAATLREAGIAPTLLDCGEETLTAFAGIDTVLDRARGGRIVGVMGEAESVLLHAIAATRGSGCLVQAHHRFHARAVHHHVRPSAGIGALTWSDSVEGWERRIAQLHAAVLGGRPPMPIGARRPERSVGAARAGLVSFVLT